MMGEAYESYENYVLRRDDEWIDRLATEMYETRRNPKVFKPKTKHKEQPKMSSYKMRNAAIILDESLTTINCRFVDNIDHKTYKFLCDKQTAKELKEGCAIVAQKSDLSLVIVWFVSADEESDINLEDTYKYSFAFQPVDHGLLGALNKQLTDSEQSLKTQQRNKLREQVRNNLILEHKAPDNVV